ncbi:CheR family methyltransferase [Microbulbifer thermotolerans]|uniref:Chemotaxis protein methyltransferase n=1 Tax=Microbulbifer thermotolerans TaxID=252514 RepID=A0AB35HZ14_MICTH|nr:CheR family methyltransferase [Microbulbifer thermotolerans]MCX2780088.1 chemotaxis protein-glutamate O-methyltransferase [Microbulbifer thermotolerans]MCX2802114.1 chemotaxis protein-glutamate O-methyltransferase [Microbulbifer thermotolerans]MCX2805512.1 chemotaxis protein-glutamate O-methyltransferase [Microbulbifer thermotolerans]MCX2831961.1 chemotaxis protein-glutamate O-methyltransferase [Microbulbifer thermotolerans]MCX2842474.1 chemotaxis protein-glutamate O-methyltransferase [Micr
MADNLSASAPESGADHPIERDLILTDADFARIRDLIGQRAGIVLTEHKRDMVYSRIGRQVRRRGMTRFSDYLAELERDSAGPDWESFVNALTTNLTGFFREAHHFRLLAEHFRGRRGPVRVWSAGASTGEEPYSIAMTLVETLGEDVDIRILGTDIDTEALARARGGIYSEKQVRMQVESARIKRFFLKGTGARAGLVRVRPQLAGRVRFEKLNLIHGNWPIKGNLDAIFCRNVMIYFDKAAQARMLERFAPLLKPDGLLFVGHSENFSQLSKHFRLRGQTVYTLA